MDLYYLPASAPCRSIQITAEAIGVPLNLKFTNLFNDEHLTPEFLRINPQHTVPTLVDNGFSLWESRAVCIYLVEKYGKDDSLYPKDPKARAIVNQRLFFDMGTLYQRFSDYYYPTIFRKQEADPTKFAPMEEALAFLDTFLGLGEYAAGNTMTIADFALMTTISTYDVANFDRTKYTNITRWYELCKKTMPGWEMNLLGAEEFRKFF